MKKLVNVSLALAIAGLSVSLFSCSGLSSKATLKTDLDTLAFTYGANIVTQQGLGQFVAQRGIDSASMNAFIDGLKEGFNTAPITDKKVLARELGKGIGTQIAYQMLPQMNAGLFPDSTKSINKQLVYAGIVHMMQPQKDTVLTATEAGLLFTTLNEKYQKAAQEEADAKFAAEHEQDKADNAKFLEENKGKEGVVTLPSGLQYKVVKEGKGPKPTATDKVKVNYHGTNIKGEVFDSSVERGTPAEFALSGVIKGWTEGIQLMPVGSKYTFYIPYDLAYGERGRGDKIGPFATLIFDVELLDIVPPAAPAKKK